MPLQREGTNTSGAIWLLREDVFRAERGDRSRAPNIGVILTDGVSSRDANLTVPYARDARLDGIILVAIGIGDAVNMDELLGIAGAPEFVNHVRSFDALPTIISQVDSLALCDLPQGK